MGVIIKDLGAVTAYAYAVLGGYVGTEAEFEALLGNIAEDLSNIENLQVIANGLPAGSSPTASYSDGVLTLGIPKGDKGDTGDGIAHVSISTLPEGSSATASYDASTETLSLGIPVGATGATGNGIQSIYKTGTTGNVDEYTILYTSGDTDTFTVTNGNVSSVAGKTGAVTLDADDVAYDDTDTYAAGTVGKELSDLNGALSEIQDDLYDYGEQTITVDEVTTTENLEMTAGYISDTGSTGGTSSYKHTKKIAVSEGDVVKYITGSGAYNLEIRFICAYNGDTIKSSAGSSSQVTSYTVPAGVTHIVLSIANGNVYPTANLHRYYTTTKVVKTFDVGEYVRTLPDTVELLDKGLVITKESASLSANTELVLASNYDNRMDDTLDFWCNFDSFDSVTVGHGKGTYGGYVTIDDTSAVVYYNGGAVKTYTHGLTIRDFIEVHVSHDRNAEASFVIMTSTGSWGSDTKALWHGCKGDIYAVATMAATNAKLTATFLDFRKDSFIFGDSYVSVGDTARWPYYADKTYKASNYALFGYGGADSAAEIVCFRNVIDKAKPAWAAWFVGMNDADTSSAINATWKTCVEEFIATCEQKGIIPVLATIPCTPTVNNTFKNAYVKSSGYAYVDFAKAVNGETAGATWYTGMLHSDNAHPTALGAKALAARLLTDMPQIQ